MEELRRGFARKFALGAVMLLAAFAMALTLQATAAYAAQASTINVGLTIVDATDDTVAYNGKISTLTEEDTVADMLAAAGYVEGTAEMAASDPKVYENGYDFPSFLGKGWDGSNYWNCLVNCTYDDGSCTALSSKLHAGYTYQYVYTDDGVFAYSSEIPNPLAAVGPNTSIMNFLLASANDQLNGVNPELVYNETLSAATVALALSALSGNQAFNGAYCVYNPLGVVPACGAYEKGLVDRFAGVDMESSGLGTDYAIVAMALANYRGSDAVDTEGLLNYYAENADSITPGALAKVILGLTAGGIDCTAVTVGDETVNLVKAMYRSIDEDTNGYSLVWVLPVCSIYLHNTGYETMVAKELLRTQESSGLFNGGWEADVQTSAQAVLALSMYGKAPAAVDNGVKALQKYLQRSGGIQETYGGPENVDSTAAVMIALAAAGADPDTCRAADSISGGKLAISTSTYTYSGAAKKPSVKVTYGGETLTNGVDYKVSYSNNVKVGTAKVTVTGTGAFKGSISKSFTIKPMKSSVKKIAVGKDKMKVSFTKRTDQVTGYQIRYSTYKSMKSAKTASVSKASYSSATIGKLKTGKKYYVQIRTYKVVNGKKYYSDWSSAKRSAKIK